MLFNREWIETSPVNAYGERVAAHVIYCPADGSYDYRCKREHWDVAFAFWCRQRRAGIESPCPMSPDHCCFVNPLDYSSVPEDCTDPRMIRRARRNRVLGNLRGWDTDLRKTIAGMRQLVRIVNATLDAQEQGASVGGAPYVACLMAGL